MSNQLLKNGFTQWVKWLRVTYHTRKRFPTARIGVMANLRGNCWFGQHSKLGDRSLLYDASLGDYSYVATDCNLRNIQIGKYCSIGPQVLAGLGIHPTQQFVSTSPVFYHPSSTSFADRSYFEQYKLTTIGHDVWIGARTILIDGVSIADGAIVGAGAVVTKDVPPYAVVGGVPARIIRYRFSPEEIDFLLHFRWWERDEGWIRKNYLLLHDIKTLMQQQATVS